MQTKNSGLLYCGLCNTSHRYAKHKCASAFGRLSSYCTTICLKLMASKVWNKHVIHLPSLLLLCLILSYCIFPNPPLWVDCLHHFWFVSICSGTTVSFLSAKLLLFGSIVMSITRTKSESFLLLCQDLETHLLVLWAFLTRDNVILDLSKNAKNQTAISWERQV